MLLVKRLDDKKLNMRYYSLLPADLENLLDRAVANESYIKTWKVTYGNRCTALHEMSMAIPPSFKGILNNLLWDGRAMTGTVEDFNVEAEGLSGSNEGRGFVLNRHSVDIAYHSG